MVLEMLPISEVSRLASMVLSELMVHPEVGPYFTSENNVGRYSIISGSPYDCSAGWRLLDSHKQGLACNNMKTLVLCGYRVFNPFLPFMIIIFIF